MVEIQLIPTLRPVAVLAVGTVAIYVYIIGLVATHATLVGKLILLRDVTTAAGCLPMMAHQRKFCCVVIKRFDLLPGLCHVTVAAQFSQRTLVDILLLVAGGTIGIRVAKFLLRLVAIATTGRLVGALQRKPG